MNSLNLTSSAPPASAAVQSPNSAPGSPISPSSKSSPMPLKVWMQREAEARGVGVTAIHMRIKRGKYPGLKLRRKNSRVIFVEV
jgi:hypothetical protein